VIELWDYCGGESSPGLFALAHTVLPGFPNKRSSTLKWLSKMQLEKPGTLVWNEQMSPEPRFLTRPGWAEIASDPFCDSVYVDVDGVCWLRSKMVDETNKRLHDSFDRWMAETAGALRDGRVRIDGDRIVCGALAYDLSPLGEHAWAVAKPGRARARDTVSR
jgi:hypothetical protein